MGLPFIKGYLPRYNFQRELTSTIQRFLLGNTHIESVFASFADKPTVVNNLVRFDKWLVQAPDLKIPKEFLTLRNPIKIDYLKKEEQNRSLGLNGEELAMEYERYCLNNVGKSSLADKIEWVSKEKGDGLGYDIYARNRYLRILLSQPCAAIIDFITIMVNEIFALYTGYNLRVGRNGLSKARSFFKVT